MTARDEILRDIRTALGRAGTQVPAPLDAPLLRPSQLGRNLYVQLFGRNLEKLAGKVLVVHKPDEVVTTLQDLLTGKQAVASNAPFLETCGLTHLPEVRSGFTDPEALRQACITADIGITSADYALAETGSLVMLSSPHEARLVSLLPPVHVAVIPRSRLLANLDELLTVIPKPADRSSSLVLITGPSRTADIEQILIRGVHGPGKVTVVIVEEA